MGRVGPRPPDIIALEHPTLTEMRKRLGVAQAAYRKAQRDIDAQLKALLSTSPGQADEAKELQALYWVDLELAPWVPKVPATHRCRKQ